MSDDFNPVEPPEQPSGNPLADYQCAPQGLGIIVGIQSIIAAVYMALTFSSLWWAASGQVLALVAIQAGLFTTSATGLHLRRGWGWWLTCAIYCFLFFGMPVDLILWTLGRIEFRAALHLALFVGATLIVAYLNRPEVLRFIRFAAPDGRPAPGTRLTPAAAGLIGAIIRLIVELTR